MHTMETYVAIYYCIWMCVAFVTLCMHRAAHCLLSFLRKLFHFVFCCMSYGVGTNIKECAVGIISRHRPNERIES